MTRRTANGESPIEIDCDTCEVRGVACGDCVVSFLLGPPPELVLDPAEHAALGVLAESGLVPPLRLAHQLPMGVPPAAAAQDRGRLVAARVAKDTPGHIRRSV